MGLTMRPSNQAEIMVVDDEDDGRTDKPFSVNTHPGSVNHPIELDETDNLNEFRSVDPEQEYDTSESPSSMDQSSRKQSMRKFSNPEGEAIELDSWEDSKFVIPEGMEVICLEDVYHEESSLRSNKKLPKEHKFEHRNPSIVKPFTICETYPWRPEKNIVFRPKKTVELQDGSFIYIKDIIQNEETSDVKIRGHRLQRTRFLNGLLESKVNEVVLFLEIDLDDPRDPLEQGAVEVPIEQVVGIRHARFTNRKFPECRATNAADYSDKHDAAQRGALTIRWKYTCKYLSAADRYRNIFKERILERIQAAECFHPHALPDETRRFRWRGETVRGGSHQPMIDSKEAHNLPTEEEFLNEKQSLSEEFSRARKRKFSGETEETHKWASKKMRHGQDEEVKYTRQLWNFQPEEREEDIPLNPLTDSIYHASDKPPSHINRTANQTLTYADAFCGGGGSTRGALLAGLRPKWGFDIADYACASWRANFPSATCYNTHSHTFVSCASSPKYALAFKVDILHLSPPCQYFSPAHTVDGAQDEHNVASLFAVQDVIKVARPRVVTLEQTFGIACPRFRWFFNALIQMFTSQDFSVRWSIVPLAQWGLPQRRSRLIIIASCPGEILPRMPPFTHSSTDDSLLPLVSVASVLSLIPAEAPDHNPDSPSLQFEKPDSSSMGMKWKAPWDDSSVLPRAMTTSGGQNYHPSGKRDLTLREFACLQGFPLDHVFREPYVKRQIGNAVPPCVAQVLFESIRRDLEEKDGIIPGAELVI